MRATVREAFGAPIADRYSSEEVGYIASQCPAHERYHVQAETVLVEIVDDEGRPVAAGATGRVLVTVLHSFAMPLIRYQVGDMAVAGSPCDCGRTLAVIERIVGREVAVLRLPDGSAKEVSILARRLLPFAPLREFRVVMYADDVVDLYFTCDQPVDETARDNLARQVQRELGYPFPVRLRQVAEIDWGPAQKRETFVRVDRTSAP
jgi:phenylacetate-CoA ligase